MKIPEEVLWARTLGMCLVNGKVWYTPMAFNGIFCADIYTGKTELISEFDGSDGKFNGLKLSYVLQVGDYLYFCPYKANYICELSCVSKKIEIYHSDYISEPYVSNAICIQNKLYMFCNKQYQIIVFDLETKEIGVVKCEYFMERFAQGNYAEKDIVYYDTSFFMAAEQKIIKFNIQSKEVYEYDLGQYTADQPVTTISFDGERFWLMCGVSKIIEWDDTIGIVSSYDVPKLGQAVHSIINGGNLYIFFSDNNHVLIFNLTDRNTSIVKIDRGYCCEQGENVFFHPFMDSENDGGVFIYTFIEHKIVYLEAGGNVSYIKLHIDQEDPVWKEIYINYLQETFYPIKEVLREQKDLFYYSLKSYLRGVTGNTKNRQKYTDCIGDKIYYLI